jgi:hypothetical protein
MLGLAIHIAQRMGIHNKPTYAKCTALEAEMRRRLWWSLIMFDNPICEMFDYKTATLAPTWDYRTPLNVNDFDIRPEMKTPPAIHLPPRLYQSVFEDYCQGYSARPRSRRRQLIALEKTLGDKYLKFCNPENLLHFMTIYTTRGYLAKIRLVEHFSRYSRSSMQQTNTQHDAAISRTLSTLECDTKLMTLSLAEEHL